MLDVCKRAHLWLHELPSIGCSDADRLSDVCYSETVQRFLLNRGLEHSTIPSQTFSVHCEQVSHLLSAVTRATLLHVIITIAHESSALSLVAWLCVVENDNYGKLKMQSRTTANKRKLPLKSGLEIAHYIAEMNRKPINHNLV